MTFSRPASVISRNSETHDLSFSQRSNAGAKLIKMLLVIETRIIGNIFASALEEEQDISVVGCATSMQDALEMIRATEVDVALVSVKLPQQSTVELTRTILNNAPATKVLALGLSDEDEDALKYIEAGAVGYILKDSSLSDLLEAVRSTQKGEAQISPKVAGAILQRLSNLTRVFSSVEENVAEARLTPRERSPAFYR